MKNISLCFFCILIILFSFSCTFDYGDSESSGDEEPDMIMENVDYVRVRSADPLARIRAERVERYEKQSIIKLQNLSFEQYGNRGNEVNVLGRVGFALVEIESGDIYMDNGVKLEVQTEDIILETDQLEWKDEPRIISSNENQEVFIYKDNGTRFSGTGLYADSRLRTWEFLGIVRGTYVQDDAEE
jgi:LPS export ABC transporter protein LptC